MPKLDTIDNAVKNALLKDGWTIIDELYFIQYCRTKLFNIKGNKYRLIASINYERQIIYLK